jgi:hypothetical protein
MIFSFEEKFCLLFFDFVQKDSQRKKLCALAPLALSEFIYFDYLRKTFSLRH